MTSRRAMPDDGQPSTDASTRLAADLRTQLAASQLAWDAALLRSDAALAEGDPAEVRAALDDHRRLLGTLEERLGAVVAQATDARETGEAADAGSTRRPRARRGASALVGAAAVLLIAGLVVQDLPTEPDGSMAGSQVAEREDAGTDRVAHEDDVAATDPRGPATTARRSAPSDAAAGPPTSQRRAPSPQPVAPAAPPLSEPPAVPATGAHPGAGDEPPAPAPMVDVPDGVDEDPRHLEGPFDHQGAHEHLPDLDRAAPTSLPEVGDPSPRRVVEPLLERLAPGSASDPETGLR